ncbi:hypothetical protein WI440_10655 [Salmonella enterica subsp. enterica serovar Typhimurium]
MSINGTRSILARSSAISRRNRSSSSSCAGSLWLMVSSSVSSACSSRRFPAVIAVRRAREFCSERTTLILAGTPFEVKPAR